MYCDQGDCKKSKPAAPMPPQPLSCSSVLGVTFDNGIMIAADCLVSYEGLAMFTNAARVLKVNDKVVLGGGSNFADLQYIQGVVEKRSLGIDDAVTTSGLKEFLRSALYNRSIRGKQMSVDLVLGGIQDGVPCLYKLDKRGFVSQDKMVATGFAEKMILPFLQMEVAKRPNGLNEEEAIYLIKRGMEILYKRHCLAFHTYHVGIVDHSGARVERITLTQEL